MGCGWRGTFCPTLHSDYVNRELFEAANSMILIGYPFLATQIYAKTGDVNLQVVG